MPKHINAKALETKPNEVTITIHRIMQPHFSDEKNPDYERALKGNLKKALAIDPKHRSYDLQYGTCLFLEGRPGKIPKKCLSV